MNNYSFFFFFLPPEFLVFRKRFCFLREVGGELGSREMGARDTEKGKEERPR